MRKEPYIIEHVVMCMPEEHIIVKMFPVHKPFEVYLSVAQSAHDLHEETVTQPDNL